MANWKTLVHKTVEARVTPQWDDDKVLDAIKKMQHALGNLEASVHYGDVEAFARHRSILEEAFARFGDVANAFQENQE